MAAPKITFYTPGVRRYQTAEHDNNGRTEFVSISLTGVTCALKCAHCNARNLRGMLDLHHFSGSLYELCAGLAEQGTRGVLISGGSDTRGRVPLLPHIPDLLRIRRELGLAVRIHVGLPDAETCAALGEVELDGAMLDLIGHRETFRDVYHLDAGPEEVEQALVWLEQYQVPTVPHIVLGLHFGRLLGEERALEMVARHTPKLLVLVVLTPIAKTEMVHVSPPTLDEIGVFFEKARQALPSTPLMLGCARPLGAIKIEIERMALDAGLNGIAFPASEIVAYARQAGFSPEYVNACCGVIL